jgi:hypothetical protein
MFDGELHHVAKEIDRVVRHLEHEVEKANNRSKAVHVLRDRVCDALKIPQWAVDEQIIEAIKVRMVLYPEAAPATAPPRDEMPVSASRAAEEARINAPTAIDAVLRRLEEMAVENAAFQDENERLNRENRLFQSQLSVLQGCIAELEGKMKP